MSFTFIFKDTSSVLSADFNPPIILKNDAEYVMGLISFAVYNSIPNVTSTNNQLMFDNQLVTVEEGAYEIADLNTIINSQLNNKGHHDLKLTPNKNTSKIKLKTTGEVDFDVPNSIGPLLGFNKRKIAAKTNLDSDSIANILQVSSLMIECNITIGSYKNGQAAHIIHTFPPSIPPGYQIIERPQPVIYLAINVKTITNISLKIVDQDGNLVNLRGEGITIVLHLKQLDNGISI